MVSGCAKLMSDCGARVLRRESPVTDELPETFVARCLRESCVLSLEGFAHVSPLICRRYSPASASHPQ